MRTGLLTKKASNIKHFSFSIAPFGCVFCANKFVSLANAIEHVEGVHTDWEEQLGKILNAESLEDDY